MNLKKLSDKELYALCKEYGLAARVWRSRFAGLLPEVMKRRLYKKKGYASVHEFAAKLAGMSKEAVDKVLRISEKLVDKPLLLDQLISGSQGWTKLERVAYIASPETDEFWAEKVEKMPSSSLGAYVQELKRISNFDGNNRLELTADGNFQPAKTSVLTFHLQPEPERKFRMFKHQFEKALHSSLTFEDALEVLLEPHLRKEAWKSNNNALYSRH